MTNSKEEQQRLMNGWFDGIHYLKITKTEDKQAFFDYISLYDMRFANYKAESQ